MPIDDQRPREDLQDSALMRFPSTMTAARKARYRRGPAGEADGRYDTDIVTTAALAQAT